MTVTKQVFQSWRENTLEKILLKTGPEKISHHLKNRYLVPSQIINYESSNKYCQQGKGCKNSVLFQWGSYIVKAYADGKPSLSMQSMTNQSEYYDADNQTYKQKDLLAGAMSHTRQNA